jgi:hypothetical protein
VDAAEGLVDEVYLPVPALLEARAIFSVDVSDELGGGTGEAAACSIGVFRGALAIQGADELVFEEDVSASAQAVCDNTVGVAPRGELALLIVVGHGEAEDAPQGWEPTLAEEAVMAGGMVVTQIESLIPKRVGRKAAEAGEGDAELALRFRKHMLGRDGEVATGGNSAVKVSGSML